MGTNVNVALPFLMLLSFPNPVGRSNRSTAHAIAVSHSQESIDIWLIIRIPLNIDASSSVV
jgi:hypothetical protein